MASTFVFVFLSVVVAAVSGGAPCVQRGAQDFRADENDCRTFHLCVSGQLVTFTCAEGSVFDDKTKSCVPANSNYDTCSQRMATHTRCAPGSRDLVPHPTQCAQYYDCGATNTQHRRGWENQLRECPYPKVFHPEEKKCVEPAEGICAGRHEPLDMCEYKENQCEGHVACVPCSVRFPSCRGRSDGLNAWEGRSGSPWFVVCHQQRVQSYDMCKQDGAVFIFDEEQRECVRKEEEHHLPEPQQRPQTVQQVGYRPQGVLPQGTYYQRPSFPNLPAYQQSGYQQQTPYHQQSPYQQRPTYQQQPNYQQRPAYQPSQQQPGSQGYQTVYQSGYQTGYYPVRGNAASEQKPVQYVWLK